MGSDLDLKKIKMREKNVQKLVGSISKITPVSSLNCSRQLILVSS